MMSGEQGCTRCKHHLCISRVPIFSGLGEEEVSRISSLIRQTDYEKGEQIVTEGTDLGGLFIINSGQVKTFRVTVDGRERILQVLSEGDFLGEKNLLARHPLTYSAEALVATRVCFIPREDFLDLMRDYPDILFNITAELCRRLDRMETMIQMGATEVAVRMNAMLLEFAAKYGKMTEHGVLVTMPLSREGIANYIGVTRETVSRKLKEMEEAGILHLIGNKRVLIHDMKALSESYQLSIT